MRPRVTAAGPWTRGGLVLLAVLGLLGGGCTRTIRGQVLDAQTGRPIAGAVVLGVWTKVAGLPGLNYHKLVGVREVETDAEGRFVLEAAMRFLGEDDESVTIYKFGYVAWNNLFIFPTSERRKDMSIPPVIGLEAFPGGQSHQRHTSFISNAARSSFYGLNNMPKFWNAFQQEYQMR